MAVLTELVLVHWMSLDVEKSKEVRDKFVVIKFNAALGMSMGFGGPKYENNTQLPAILAYCIHGVDSSVCLVQVKKLLVDLTISMDVLTPELPKASLGLIYVTS